MIGSRRSLLATGERLTTVQVELLSEVVTDCELSSNAPTVNNGSGETFKVGEDINQTGHVYRSLIKFDLAAIAADATVLSAQLLLSMNQDVNASTASFRIHRLKRAWVEGEATWNEYSSGNSWQTAGGFGADDVEQTQISSTTIVPADGDTYMFFTLSASAIEEIVSGAWVNNGFLLKMNGESNDLRTFSAANTGSANVRPKLRITYTVPR